jgi:hypothetical protein
MRQRRKTAAHIVRIDSDTTHGYQARVAVTGSRHGLNMLCSDSIHGGPTKARMAAQAALRLLKLQALVMERQRVASELRARPLVRGGAA